MHLLDFERKDLTVIFNLWKMNLKDKYLGSFLGITWAVLQPALYLALYTFVFGYIFRVQGSGEGRALYNLVWMFSGMIPFLVFSEAITTATNSIIMSSALVKNIVFKSETIPIAYSLSAVVPLIVGLFFLVILRVADGQSFTWYILLLIPVIILQFVFLIGLAFFLSATAVFFRDIVQIVPTIMMAFLFFTPIFYSIESMPRFAADLTFFNPLYQMVQPYRDILISHTFPNLYGMAYMCVLSILLVVIGIAYFRRLKGYFEVAL